MVDLRAPELRAREALNRIRHIDRAYVAEVGINAARMAGAMLRQHPTMILEGVDSYLGAEHQPADYVATRDTCALRSQYQADLAYDRAAQSLAKFGSRVKLRRLDSLEAAALFPKHSFDLVFLDADHSQTGLARDIAAWRSKVKRGGWIGGHDIGNADARFDFSGVARAVQDAFSATMVQMGENFTWWVKL